MRRKIGLLVLLAVLTPACVHKNTPATPVAAAAMRADSIMVRVNELQAVVIDWCGPAAECAPGTLPTATARQIVGGLISLRSTLVKTPAGWQTTAKTAWNELKPRFAGVTNPSILAAFNALDAVLGAL